MPIVHYLFGSESPRREAYGEGLLMPGAGNSNLRNAYECKKAKVLTILKR